MISWLSFTTSKVLPTFVGEEKTTASNSSSDIRLADNVSESFSSSTIITPSKTRIEHFNFFVGAADISETQVLQNSTFRKRTGLFGENFPPTILTAALATIRQETTKTESYERQIQTTKTISAYDEEEGAGPLFGYVWTTTQVEKTLANGETTNIPSVTQVTTNTAETVVDFVTTEAQRTVITTTGAPIELTTYTAINGNVEVVAHTIVEANNAVSFNSPQAETPVTELSFAPTRFTLSYSEAYTKTLPIRDDSESTIGVTTTQTISENHATTMRGFSNESYKGWQASFETKSCPNRPEGVGRTIPSSFELNHGFTVESQTTLNTTQETFETYFGGNSETFVNPDNYTTGVRLNDDLAQRTRTHFVLNTVSEEISTFSVSGDFFKFSSQSWPGLVDRNGFPWKTDGDEARRYFNITNNQTSIIATTSEFINFGHTYKIQAGNPLAPNFIFEAKKIGDFFEKISIFEIVRTNAATAIEFQHTPFADHGLASPQLSFTTQNTHATVGAFMTDNAQHTWEGWPLGYGIERGFISQGVVGAVPLYPTFSGLIRRDAEGWEVCDSSEYTTVAGSRIGENFSTTIAWKTIEGTSTKNSTSSGSFTIKSTTVATVGATQNFTPTIAGGFATPNASRTVIVSPGVVLMTTYDAESSGTLSASYSTGTTETTAPVGPVPITLSSFLPRVQGYGVYTQALLDDGMP